MRGPRAFLFLTGVLVLLGLVSYGLFQLALPRYYDRFGGGNNAAAGAQIGQTVFVGLVFLTLLLICAIAPSLTAGAISGEHQRKTYDLLMATPLAPFTILAGKLGAALSYVLLILLAAVPMTSLAYVFGGVTMEDLVKAFAVMGGLAIVFSVMGLFFSALFKRTGIAVGVSYLLLGLATLGSFFIYAVVGVMRGEQPPNWLLAVNPFSALASALVEGVVLDPNSVYSGSAMTPLLWGLAGGRFDNTTLPQIPLWQYTLALYASLTLLWLFLATQLIKPVRRFQFGRVGWLLIVLVIVGVIGALVAVFAPRFIPPLRAAWIWQNATQRNIVPNGTFLEPPDWNWQIAAVAAPTAKSETRAQTEWQRTTVLKGFVRVWNPTVDAATLTLTQPLNVPISEVAQVKLRLVLQIRNQASEVCGAAGDECPVMVQLRYTDVGGQAHTFTHGFYANGKPRPGIARACLTCEDRPQNQRVNMTNWITWESPDLYDARTPEETPRTFDSITVQFAGAAYDVLLARVNVLVREGRPLDFRSRFNATPRWSYTDALPYQILNFLNQFNMGGSSRRVPGGFIIQTGPAPFIAPPTAAPLPPFKTP